MELRRRLGVLHRYYAGLMESYPDLLWAKQPDTIRFCQIMGGFADVLMEIRIAAEEAERHCKLLFDLSHNEGERRGVFDRRDT